MVGWTIERVTMINDLFPPKKQIVSKYKKKQIMSQKKKLKQMQNDHL